MASAKKNISISSARVFVNPRSFSFILICILCIYVLVLSGCSLRLFEIPVDKRKTTFAKEEIDKKKVKDKEKIKELIEVLETRSRPEIEQIAISKDESRYIRKDLRNFITQEWEKGWKYLKSMDMNTYASSIEGIDGVLVPKKALRKFNPGDYRVYATDSKPGIKLSFIHLSDVQLRDERVYMFREGPTQFLDYFSSGFAHDPYLIMYDHSYYLTLIGVMRLLNESQLGDQKPSFMIHTGDVAHMGVVSEHYEFIYITNKLKIPWFNVLGNHDYPVYGNLSSEDVGVIDPNMGFQTLSSRYNFINMHGKGFEIDQMVYFSPENAPDDETLDKGSVYNGFDMKGAESVVDGNIEKPCEECPGYYYLEAVPPQGKDPGILVVVIDTSVEDFHFSDGSVCRNKNVGESKDKKKCDREQIDWLEEVLKKYAKEGNWMVLAYGHHALNRKSFCDDSYEKVTDLFHNPKYNVIAYFCGHSHEHWIKYHRNEDNPESFGFWEITTDSAMEYPKKGSLVNIVYTDEKYWEITLQSFWPYFLDGDLPDAPQMLINARKCFQASKDDNEGKKKKRYDKLHEKHHDAVLPFSFPKVQ